MNELHCNFSRPTGGRIQLLDLLLVGLDEEVLQLQVGRALIGVTPVKKRNGY